MARSRILFLGTSRTLPEELTPGDCASVLSAAYPHVDVETVASPSAALDALDESVSCLVSGVPLDDDGLSFLRDVRDQHQTVSLVYLAETPSEQVPLDALSLGVAEHRCLRAADDPADALTAAVCSALPDDQLDDHGATAQTDADRSTAPTTNETGAVPAGADRYRQLVRHIADPVYMIDDEGYVTMVNEALLTKGGFERDEFVGKHVTEVMPPDDVEQGTEIILELIQSDETESETFEMEIIHADGTHREYEDHVSVMYDEDGAYEGSVGIVRDIKERKERERELEQYETIVETVPYGVFVLDEHGTIVSGNERAAEMIGIQKGAVVGTSVPDLIDQEILSATVLETYNEIVGDLVSDASDRETGRFEFTICPDGTDEERIFEARIALRPYDDAYRGIVGVMQDVTDRKQRIEELERYETIVQAVPDALWSADEHGYFTFINEAGVEQFGYTQEEIQSNEIHFSEIVADDEVEKFSEALVRLLSEDYDTGENAVVQYTGIRKDGRRFPAETYLSPMEPTEEGVASAGIARDISDRKQREERIEVLDRVLRHNLRNDLNTILANAELLIDRLRTRHDDEQGAKIAEVACSQTQQLVEISSNVRQIQQALERDRMDHPEIDAVELVATVVSSFQTTNPDVTIETELPDRALVEADESLELVVENVVENAIEHHDSDHPEIKVSISEQECERGEWYEITVRDDGPGIPTQELVAVDGDRTVTPLRHGSGIGLWAVAWIVQSFDGSVDIAADEAGSVVTLTLRKAS